MLGGEFYTEVPATKSAIDEKNHRLPRHTLDL
jgi:hypothetical protein